MQSNIVIGERFVPTVDFSGLQDLLAKRESGAPGDYLRACLLWDLRQIGSHHREPMIKNDIPRKTIAAIGTDMVVGASDPNFGGHQIMVA